jgi:hypothetical protein
MEALTLKVLGIGFLVFVVVPIFKFWITAKAKQKIWEQTKGKKQDKGKNIARKEVDLRQYQAIKEIWKQEREKYYLEARDIFKDNMQQKRMERSDIIELINMLNGCIGEEYLNEYKDYTHTITKKQKDGTEIEVVVKGFTNQAHEIYVKLKNWHITPHEWEKIIGYLKSFQDNTKEEII